MTEISGDRSIIIPADVVFTEIESDTSPQGVLLNLVTRQYYSLNETGLVIWKQLAAGATPEAVGQELTTRYAVDPVVALACVKELLNKLAEAKLLSLKPLSN